jgi:hypothetical protein
VSESPLIPVSLLEHPSKIDTTKFEQQYGIRLLQRSGSGHGPTATFTFSVEHSAGERNPGSPLLGREHPHIDGLVAAAEADPSNQK